MTRKRNSRPWILIPAVACAAAMCLVPGDLPAQERTTEPEAESAPASSGEIAPIKSKLTRLQGRAYLGRRQPVVGASVTAILEDGSGKIFMTSSDDRGEIRIDDLPDGDYRLEIDKEGLQPVVKPGVNVKFPFRPVVEISMTPEETATATATANTTGDAAPAPATTPSEGFTVTGRIVERSGEGIPEVTLALKYAEGTVDPRLVRSRGDGTFELEGIVPGTWRVVIRGVGFLPIRVQVDLAGPTDLAACLVQQPAEYVASPLDLMPPEEPVPPPELP